MKKVFVSGCYDILHGGHVEFFTQAKALGDYLIVSVAADDVLWNYKKRKSSIPIAHKVRLIQALNVVDEVVVSSGNEPGLNFKEDFLKHKPNILAVTEDDSFAEAKKQLCEQIGAQYVCLPKTLSFQKVSTSSILNFIKAPSECPLRVDFAGGWLDVPRFARPGSYIVNCTISPLVSLDSWPYQTSSGLGGSAAYALLAGKNSIEAELAQNVGWQDPAVIQETGLCVWKSGEKPRLDMKIDPEWLQGHMALLWTGTQRFSGAQAEKTRNYEKIIEAGACAREAVFCKSISILRKSIDMSYSIQLFEGMKPLARWGASSMKYCGAGWGGYAMYLFTSELDREDFLTHHKDALAVEPYLFDKYR